MTDWWGSLNQQLDKKLGKLQLSPIRYRLATPSTQLNCALGMGLPGGRLTEIIGDEQAGKTGTVSSWAAAVQALGGRVWYSDPETKFDYGLGQKVGLNYDPSVWRYDQPRYLEEYFEALENSIEEFSKEQSRDPEGPPTMWVLDSLAMLGIKALNADKVTTQKLRPMSASQCITNFFQRSCFKKFQHLNAYLVFVNHLRDNPDTLGYGNKPQYKTPGGKAVKFMEGIRIFVKAIKFCKTNDCFFEHWERHDSDYGYNVHYYVEKNSFGAPWREAQIPFFFHKGYDDGIASLQYLRDKGHCQYKGGFIINDQKVASDWDELLNRTQQDPGFVQYLQQTCMAVYQGLNTYTQDDFIL